MVQTVSTIGLLAQAYSNNSSSLIKTIIFQTLLATLTSTSAWMKFKNKRTKLFFKTKSWTNDDRLHLQSKIMKRCTENITLLANLYHCPQTWLKATKTSLRAITYLLNQMDSQSARNSSKFKPNRISRLHKNWVVSTKSIRISLLSHRSHTNRTIVAYYSKAQAKS